MTGMAESHHHNRAVWTTPRLVPIGGAGDSDNGSVPANKETIVTTVCGIVYEFSLSAD